MKRRKISPIKQAKEELMKEIEALNQSMEIANSNFENVSDPDLIDSYIYEMNAISFRYKYLIRQMRNIEAQGNVL
ncbi:MAG: YaaL family protein [Lachnospiraceae bacterium]|nr:YaaL family protein [Lachnospiraceae bacterium]